MGLLMAKHIETKRDVLSRASKYGFGGRHLQRDGGHSRQNGHSFHGRLLDELDY